jgi:hypothetical protein
MSTYVDGGATVSREGDRKPMKAGGGSAGLVLLYAIELREFPKVIPFGEGQTIIGRTPPAGGIALPQEAVSRVHARFTFRDGVWYAVDLNSRNGTFVRGERITEVALRPLDEIQIGDAIFKFVPESITDYAPYRIDGAVDPPQAASPIPELLGGLQMRRIADALGRIAQSDLSVLLTGETGTGKEVAARAIHRLSGRAGRFDVVNCAGITGEPLEAELAGQAAGGGTLMLDEIGDMTPEGQAKLLRSLETRGPRRVLCATQHDLRELVGQGRFRGDLFARVSGCEFRLPPLRERKEDLYALLVNTLSKSGVSVDAVEIAFDFMKGLCAHSWPFNVRELENVIRWSLATWDGRHLATLPETLKGSAASGAAEVMDLPARKSGPLDEAEVRALLRKHAGNVSAVAREVGKDRAQIHRWMREHAIRPEDYREP